MKKLILLSISLLFSGITIRAGEVFPTSNAIWNMHRYLNGDISEIIYGLIGDTVINNKTYQKMYFLADTILSLENAEYVGGFRTDRDQVWFLSRADYEEDKVPEFLLYDFSKEIGDTIYHGIISSTLAYTPFYTPIMAPREKKSIIQNVTIDSNNRKHIYTNESEWIEGIGDINGFFHTFYTYLTNGDEVWQELACYKQNGIIEYNTNTLCNKCFCMKLYETGVEEHTNKCTIKIIPTSKQRCIYIKLPTKMSAAQINIYDIAGNLLYLQSFSNHDAMIYTSDFQPGLYIYRISHLGESLQSGKIIIQ